MKSRNKNDGGNDPAVSSWEETQLSGFSVLNAQRRTRRRFYLYSRKQEIRECVFRRIAATIWNRSTRLKQLAPWLLQKVSARDSICISTRICR